MPEPIHSIQNARIKSAVRLREASHRRSTGLLLIDGVKEIRQAILGGVEIEELFIEENSSPVFDLLELQTNERSTASMKHLEELTTYVSLSVLEKLSFGNRNERLVAVAKQPSVALDRVVDHPHGLILVIDQAEKPGNIGAMVRTADAVGASAVLLSDPVCEVWNPNAIRASLGALFRIPIAVGTSKSIIEWLLIRDYQTVAARVDGSVAYRPFAWSAKNAIVVGSESSGLGPAWHHSKIIGMQLPMRGTVDSLNVSVTAAVLLYEASSCKSLST